MVTVTVPSAVLLSVPETVTVPFETAIGEVIAALPLLVAVTRKVPDGTWPNWSTTW